MIDTQEVCGPGSSNDVFLKCLVKTRQWQDTQILNRSDPKPWLAYYRTLGCLDAERISSRGITENQGEAFQQQVLQWVDECMQLTQLAVSSQHLWGMLKRVQQEWQRQTDVELHPWQDSFLYEPLHYQWMTPQEILQNADSHPFNLGHNCGSVTSLFASVCQPVDPALQQEEGGIVSAAWWQQPQQQGSLLVGQGLPGPSQNGGSAGWPANADGTTSAWQHQNQLQAGYLPSDLDLAAIQLSDEMLEPLPSRLPVAQDWLGHGTAQAQGQQQGSLAETNEVAYSCSLLTCIRLCHCTCGGVIFLLALQVLAGQCACISPHQCIAFCEILI